MIHRIYKVEFKVPTGWFFVERNTADWHTTLRYVSYAQNCRCGSGCESGLNLSGGFELSKARVRSLLDSGMIGKDVEWRTEDPEEFIEAVVAAAFDLAKIADDKSSKISEPTKVAMDEVVAVFDHFYEQCGGPTTEQINSANASSSREKRLQEQRLVAIRAAGNLSNATFTKLRNQTEV